MMPLFCLQKKLVTLPLLALILPVPAQASGEKTWATISDVGVNGLTAVAIGLPIIKKDKQGAFQAIGSVGASSLLAVGLKETFPETRPDGSDRKSFPSGHTSRAFGAAATLYRREGADVGFPAFAVATLVGISRVKARKHYWHDVAVGAGIGMAAGFLITNKRPESQSALVPWGDSKGGGISFAMRF
jgi:membrane-associated phospholipid phosphatase